MSEKDEFIRVCAICKADAKESGHKRYVKRRASGFVVSGDGNEWLFYAYPGGKAVFSVDGAKIAGV